MKHLTVLFQMKMPGIYFSMLSGLVVRHFQSDSRLIGHSLTAAEFLKEPGKASKKVSDTFEVSDTSIPAPGMFIV